MSSSQNLNIKVSKRTHFLDHVLLEVIHSLDRSLSRDQTLSNIKGVLEKNNNSQNNLGWCYQNGEGVEVDFGKAFQCYEKSAKAGNSYGQNNLGWCYECGKGVEADLKKALYWYKKSAEVGDSYGQNNLGMCYLNG